MYQWIVWIRRRLRRKHQMIVGLVAQSDGAWRECALIGRLALRVRHLASCYRVRSKFRRMAAVAELLYRPMSDSLRETMVSPPSLPVSV